MMKNIFLLFFTIVVMSTQAFSADDIQADNCDFVLGFIKNRKYEYIRPNEEEIARKLYIPKIEQVMGNYIRSENKELISMYYADAANNGKYILLAEIKNKDFCNYSYLVYVSDSGIRKLFPNNGRDYTSDFQDNYKLFCKGGSVVSIITVNGMNYIVSSNHGGRINRIDRLVLKGDDINTVNVCRF